MPLILPVFYDLNPVTCCCEQFLLCAGKTNLILLHMPKRSTYSQWFKHTNHTSISVFLKEEKRVQCVLYVSRLKRKFSEIPYCFSTERKISITEQRCHFLYDQSDCHRFLCIFKGSGPLNTQFAQQPCCISTISFSTISFRWKNICHICKLWSSCCRHPKITIRLIDILSIKLL